MIRMDDIRRREGRTTRGSGYSYKKPKESLGNDRGRAHSSSKQMPGRSSDSVRIGTQVSGVHLVERPWDTDGDSQRSNVGTMRATKTFGFHREV